MNRHTHYTYSFFAFLLLLISLGTQEASAQKSYLHDLRFEESQGVRRDGKVAVLSNIILDDLRIGTQDLLILAPKIISHDGRQELTLSPVFIAGKTRAKVMERELRFNHTRAYMTPTPPSITTRRNGTAQTVQYSSLIPYEQWMDNASLTFEEKVIGCAECDKGHNHLLVADRFLKPLYKPAYKLLYVMPEVEPIKNRAEKYVATVNFHVDRDHLDLNYRNNRAVISEIEDKVAKVVHNDDLKVSDIEIAGYASPEASVAYNRSLSERRAKSIADYLVSKFSLPRQQMKVVGYGEDWGMTRDEVAKSALADKEQVLHIIDTTPELDARDAKIKQLSGGATYQTILKEIYPRIRRTEYTLSYVVRAFDVEEARQVIKTNPKLLSLNEMYLVAKSYPAESKDFKEVFDIATRLYPNEPVAIINASAADIEGGNYQAAIERLQRIADNPQSYNNLAVAYARSGDYAQAMQYFDKAKKAGDTHAIHNMSELQKLLDQKEGK